jgi:hypothetical protein
VSLRSPCLPLCEYLPLPFAILRIVTQAGCRFVVEVTRNDACSGVRDSSVTDERITPGDALQRIHRVNLSPGQTPPSAGEVGHLQRLRPSNYYVGRPSLAWRVDSTRRTSFVPRNDSGTCRQTEGQKRCSCRAGRAFWAKSFTGHTRVIGSTHWDRTGTFVLMCLP